MASPAFCLTLLALSWVSLGIDAWSDPDINRWTPELIESRGFEYEEHYAETADHYFLMLFRIVNPRIERNATLRPVILQHGLLSSSRDWLVASPGGHVDENSRRVGNNLGFELAKRGYDVWLPNSRGNTHSKFHRYYTKDESHFWDFTWADMGKYDNPAVIDYVLHRTGHEDLAFVGYSQGTMTMWATMSLYPKYNKVVKPFIALAPVMSLNHVSKPVKVLAYMPLLPTLLGALKGQFMPSNTLIRSVAYIMCNRPFKPMCASLIGIACGFDYSQLNQSRMDVYMAGIPAGTSNKNVMHFRQLVRSGVFAEYDYGASINKQIYGWHQPPEFPLHKITNPYIAIFSGANDWLASPQDVNILRMKLGVEPLVDHVVPAPRWNHLNFQLGVQVGLYINKPIIELLERFNPDVGE